MVKITIDKILTAVFSLVILFCMIFIIRDIINYKQADNEYSRLNEYMPAEVTAVSSNEPASAPDIGAKIDPDDLDFDRLYEINSDLVCVISIPALKIRYPVVQGSDNSYYLDTTFEGNKNPSGCLFMDYKNNCDLTDQNTIIYGHNMKDGSMFGSLKQLLNKDIVSSDVYAYIINRGGESTYRLKDARVVSVNDYNAPADEDGLLTLYTCWGNDKSRRLLATFSRADPVI